MADIREFLTRRFLPHRDGLTQPDGRLLYLYRCDDDEFWCLVDLLRECGPPDGHDFDHYRQRWQALRGELQSGRQHRYPSDEATDLDWTVRGFVLYASEFWLRFKNEEWRERSFPDALPFRKLTWLQFLSLVDWIDLYSGKVVGYVRLRDTKYRVAHTNDNYSSDEDPGAECGRSGDEDEPTSPAGQHRTGVGQYPGLYFPMLAAWEWWKVAPVRLPSSIRYLDTFAHQGGASNRLMLECRIAFESGSKLVYEPIRPPNGYGIEFLSLEKKSLPPSADLRELSITLVFGIADGAYVGD